MVLGNVLAGGATAFSLLGLIAVSNVISSYIFNGQTLNEIVEARTGLEGGSLI
jgi:hypothetical protein|tara:strand:- start:332 stop:490 length:159 start_codon:yes stop_codon:yes gene_type:complete